MKESIVDYFGSERLDRNRIGQENNIEVCIRVIPIQSWRNYIQSGTLYVLDVQRLLTTSRGEGREHLPTERWDMWSLRLELREKMSVYALHVSLPCSDPLCVVCPGFEEPFQIVVRTEYSGLVFTMTQMKFNSLILRSNETKWS